jgi:peptidoglycan/LPS O-acetylase OafA/YrhL
LIPTQYLSGAKGRISISIQAPKPSAGRFYRPELDVVRFLAFLLVFLHHTLPHSGNPRIESLLKSLAPVYYTFAHACRFGLSLFFTLSAFLICELLLREREAAGTVGVKQFYIRRILRIWPLYYLGLALGLVFAFLPGGEPASAAKLGWFAIFMGAWYCATQGALVNPANVLWSISVEEQFYLFAPWIIKHLNRKSVCGFCLALILFANLWLFHLGRIGISDFCILCNSFVQFQCFAAGILLCLLLHGQAPRIAAWHRLILTAGCCIFWMIAASGQLYRSAHHPSDFTGSSILIGAYALSTLGCVMLLAASLGATPKLLPGWAVYLGRISFGLYVYHDFSIFLVNRLPISSVLNHAKLIYPAYAFLSAALTIGLPLGLTLLAAALSYRYFETPFLKMKKRHSVIESQPIQGAE